VTGPGGQNASYRGTADALEAVRSGLSFLAAARAGSLPVAELAECLRVLERAESLQTVARANVLAAFAAQEGYADDGQGGARSWLAWQTRVTKAAAAGAVAWVRRLGAHPLVAGALAAGELSASWARQLCAWSDRLPAGLRDDADQILLAAADGGARLGDLAALAEEMHRRSVPDDDDDGFIERGLQLDIHWKGAGRLTADLTPECAAALAAVLESLGKRAGPEDDRSKVQRQHDALEEACRRLTGSGCLPDRAGQPTQVQLHVTLDQLLDLTGRDTGPATPGPAGHSPGPACAGPGRGTESTVADGMTGPSGLGREDCGGRGSASPFGPGTGNAAGIAETAAGAGEPGWLQTPAAALACTCDAQITPIVTGHADPARLDWLAAALAARQSRAGPDLATAGLPHSVGPADDDGRGPPGTPPSTPATMTASRFQDTVLRYAVQVLSGPSGLAAQLRDQALGHRFPAVSLPLDVGAATDQIPPHLRRAVITRDRHCAFPGCTQPPAACQVHHIIPRSEGGPTALTNLMLACSFHHLVAIHRWGWRITLHGDGTTTATSPDSSRVLHSHSPPPAAAA
jgi:hypothetical protein